MKMNRKVIISLIILITFSFFLPINNIVNAFLDSDHIYKAPDIIEDQRGEGLDDMIKDAEKFEKERGATIGDGNSGSFTLNQGKLKDFSSNLYTILVSSATAVSIIVGLVIGIKYMTGSVEQKAEYKKLLVPYVVGCITVFGALGIWQLLVTILEKV